MFSQQKIVAKANQAVVVALDGKAVMKSYLNDKEEPLVVGKPLFPFDQVRCLTGDLTVSEFGKIVRLAPSPMWHTIYSPNPAFRKYSPLAAERAGSTPGEQIFDYPQFGFVIPNRFHLRWKPFVAASGKAVQVQVRVENEILWPPKNTRAFLPRNKTEWTPKDLQAALSQKQHLGNSSSHSRLDDFLQLRWTDEDAFPFSDDMPPAKFFQIRGSLYFQLISVEENKELEADFQEMKRNFDPPTVALYQARWFADNNCVGDAADAYETAARLSPTRNDIKDVTLDFLRDYRMYERARQLQRDLFRQAAGKRL